MADENNQPQFWDVFRSNLNKEDMPPELLYEEMFKSAAERPITYEEFYYLLSRYAFLDIQHSDGAKPIAGRAPKTMRAKSGWKIQDYGDRIRTSPGRLTYGSYTEKNQKQGKEVKLMGTLVQQFADTAGEVIALAIAKKWPSAQVYSGFYGMIRAAWIAADSQKFVLTGFDPTVNDEVVKNWVEQLLSKKLEAIAKLKSENI